jgi:hypothetical protein
MTYPEQAKRLRIRPPRAKPPHGRGLRRSPLTDTDTDTDTASGEARSRLRSRRRRGHGHRHDSSGRPMRPGTAPLASAIRAASRQPP